MKDLLAKLSVEELIRYIDSRTDAASKGKYGKPGDRAWCIGRGAGDNPRLWYIGIDFDEGRIVGEYPGEPDPSWTVWTEGEDLASVLAAAIVEAEREVWG